MKAFSLGIHSAIWYYISKDNAENIIGSSRKVRTDQEGGGVSVAVSFLLTYITGLLLESISNIIAYTPAILLALYLYKRFIRRLRDIIR